MTEALLTPPPVPSNRSGPRDVPPHRRGCCVVEVTRAPTLVVRVGALQRVGSVRRVSLRREPELLKAGLLAQRRQVRPLTAQLS